MEADELPHRPGPGSLWAESWYFDFVAPDGSFGGYVRLGHYPNQGSTWLWVALGGSGAALPTVVRLAERASTPDRDLLHASWGDLSIDLDCVEAGRTWAVGARFSTAAGQPGRLDLAWTGARGPYRYGSASRYEQPCRVEGVVRVAGESLAVGAWPGQRDHSWGIRDWWRLPWLWCAGSLDDGTRFQGTRLVTPRPVPVDGYVVGRDEPAYRPLGKLDADLGSPSVPSAPLTLEVDDLCLDVQPVLTTTVPLPRGPGRDPGRLDRSMCRFETTDGTKGVGWLEHNQPATRPRPG
jgi:hypothetical protein